MFNFPIALDDSSHVPLYEQLSISFRDAITQGKLPAGTIMPSTRILAKTLGVSRFTILHSLELLTAQGYVQATATGRILISDRFEPFPETPSNRLQLCEQSAPSEKCAEQEEERLPSPDESNDPNQVPFNVWRDLAHRQLRNSNPSALAAVAGHTTSGALRKSLCDHLARFASVICEPEQIFVFPSFNAALDVACRTVLTAGDSTALEDPCPFALPDIIRSHGATVAGLPADDEGIDLDSLRRKEQPVKLVQVSANANHISGATLSLKRKNDLLDWAGSRSTVILECDSDLHRTAKNKRLATLQALSQGRSVIYVSTFKSVLGELAPYGFAVFPVNLAQKAEQILKVVRPAPAALDQLVLADFIQSGYLERQILKNEKALLFRRQQLSQALVRRLHQRVSIQNHGSLGQLVIRLNLSLSNMEIMRAAAAANIMLYESERFYLEEPGLKNQFIIPLAGLVEGAIESEVEKLFDALNAAGSASAEKLRELTSMLGFAAPQQTNILS